MQDPANLEKALKFVQTSLSSREHSHIGVVLGTGLGDWINDLQNPVILPYEEIPGFPRSTVQSHTGRLIHGQIGNTPVLALEGRFHLYEGYTPEQVCSGIRLLALLGIKHIVITNASGAINPHFETGSIMLIKDQINMTGTNPLTGPNVHSWGPRFPDMSQLFCPSLQNIALKKAISLDIRLERGVYIGVHGPCLETPAETRAYRRLGADAIGMSTVMETIAAKHMGLNILGLSCLTNKNSPDCMAETSLEEIIEQAQKTGSDLQRLLSAIIPEIISQHQELV
jgi:purine-nucleoside phosphorylase